MSLHPFLQERATFQKRYTYALWYHVLKAAQTSNALPDLSLRQLARTLHLPSETLRMWMADLKCPDLLCSLTLLDDARHRQEASLPATSGCQHVDPSEVYRAFSPFHSHAASNRLTPASLAVAIEQLSRSVPDPPRILLAELRPYHRNGPRWFRSIAKEISTHRSEIQEQLRQFASRRGLHIGITRCNLYIWCRNSDPDDWLNICDHELFCFENSKEKNTLVDEALYRLNGITIRKLSELIHQMTHHPHHLAKNKTPLTDLRHNRCYLVGESLHFILDATGKRLQDIRISAIGRGCHGYGRIRNPRFRQGEALDEFRARALAVFLSDGSLDNRRVATYMGDEPDRVQYIRALFSDALGDIEDNVSPRLSRVIRLRFPAVVGRILERWGMPAGDKLLQRFQLPEAVKNGTNRVRCGYVEEVIPEEGCFSISNSGRRLRMGIGRTAVLDAGSKTGFYAFKPKIAAEQKQALETLAKNRTHCRTAGLLPSQVGLLTWADLRKAAREMESPERHREAQRIVQLINRNPPRLLVDEKELLKSIGIKTRMHIVRINLYRSGRVSVAWEIWTRSTKDVIRWAILAPPSPGRKRKSVREWCSENQQLVNWVKNQELQANSSSNCK